MNKEDMLTNFVESLILLTRIQNLVKDSFFSDKFKNKIQSLVYNYIYSERVTADDVAQYRVMFEKLNHNIDDLSESLQDMAHINILRISPLFLQVNKSLLAFKLEIIRKSSISIAEFKKSNKLEVKEKYTENIQKQSRVKKDGKLNESKKKILDFIRSYPDSRTKDIISEFSIFSDRTVKRNLMELLQNGLVKKRINNKAVYYSTAD